jgi:hypothetical protein
MPSCAIFVSGKLKKLYFLNRSLMRRGTTRMGSKREREMERLSRGSKLTSLSARKGE